MTFFNRFVAKTTAAYRHLTLSNRNDDDNFIDVKKLINENKVEELCQTAEDYFKRIPNWDNLLAKPFASSNEAQHLLVNFSHLITGLQLLPDMTILDFGSGSSWTSKYLNQMGFSVISLDVSITAITMGKELKKRHQVFGKQPEHMFLHFDGKKINLPDDSVDRIFCLDAFHHVPNQLEILREMSRVLKQGGIAGFSEPGPNHSKESQSQFEMRNFKVIENDIILEEIFKHAKSVGFTEMRAAISGIYPMIMPFRDFDTFLENKELISDYLNRTNSRMKNFPIFFLYKGKIELNDSRSNVGLITEINIKLQSMIIKEFKSFNIEVEFTNISNKIWLPSGDNKGCVNIGAFLFELDKDGSRIDSKELRFSLSATEKIMPGQKVTVDINMAGLKSGNYILEVDLVSEYICWFQFNGSEKAIICINVEK